MNNLRRLIDRNTKLFFKDKGMFFCSLITPIILLVLYITFLGKVFRDSITGSLPPTLIIEESIINSLVSGQLFASLLSVCCVTVAFCSNVIIVQDKITGARKDLLTTPLKKSTLAISYYVSALISTLIICLVATGICMIYIACTGWYMSIGDCMLLLLDVFMLTMFGTALSSIINHFLNTQGQVSAVSTIISSMYGFICGAYMPIASFGTGLINTLMFLPGTYATSLIKNHALRGPLEAFNNAGVPNQVIDSIKDSIDYNIYFFDHSVSIGTMYGIVITTVVVLVAIYILINFFHLKKFNKKSK